MIVKLTSTDKHKCSDLFDQMFRSRALVFQERLGWNVMVKDRWEFDSYDDAADPLYLLSLDEDGRLKGSLRVLPTTGPTMINSEFAGFFADPIYVCGPTIWECTKFCVLPGTAGTGGSTENATSTELLSGLCELCLSSGIEFIIGVFDNSMSRIYRRIGWSPEILAIAKPEIGNISVGMWEATDAALAIMNLRLFERTSRPSLVAA